MQLELALENPNPSKAYRVLINGKFVLETDDKEKAWERIGQATFGSAHEVRGPDGKCVAEFVPY